MQKTGYLVIWLLLLQLGGRAGQIGYLWSFDDLRSKSDLVVIAAVVATRDIGIRTVINELQPPFPVVELNTQFKIVSVVKGTSSGEMLVLRHYRLDTDRLRGGVVNAARPLDFTTNGSAIEYLLFLKRDAGEIFVPTSGQVFPGDSVFALRKAG